MTSQTFTRAVLAIGPLLFVAALATGALAQGEGFTESFADPALPGWEHSANAQVVDGILHIEPGGFAFHPGRWADLILEVSARFVADTTLEIGYSATDQGEYTLRLEPDRLTLQRNASQLAQVALEPIPPGEWMRVTVNLNRGQHEIRRGDRLALTANDPDPLPPGGLMLRVADEGAGEFDDLTLTAVGAPPGTPEPAQSAPRAAGLPAYQAGSWIRLGGPPGGLGYDIRMQPDNPDVMFVTDGFTGTYKSVDGGLSWFVANNGVETAPGAGTTSFCATIDPHDYDTVWIGLQLSGHIYRSTDGGQTWEQRDNGLIFEDCLRSVRGITIDPNDANVVYAGVEVDSRCWAHQTLSRRQGVVRGEVYRSNDGGLNWTRVWEGENLARYIWVDPRNSDRVYVSTGIFDRDAYNSDIPNNVPGGVGILRSDDGGQTWEILDGENGLGGLYIPSLFMHPENPDILLAAVTSPAITPGGEGVYVTYDGGDTWHGVLEPEPNLSMDAVEISLSDPDIWYAATENLAYRSDDAGQTWERFDMVTPDRVAGMPIDLQVDPRDPRRIFVNSYNGGNMMSADGGQTWVDASQGYTGVRVHALAVAPGTGWTVFANEFRSDDGGQTWVGTDMAGRSLVILPEVETASYRLLAAATYGLFGISDDGGLSWQSNHVADTGGSPYSTVLAASPSDPQTVFLGYFHWNCGPSRNGGWYELCFDTMPGLFRSQDGGLTWQSVQAPADGSITALAVHPQDPQTVYAGTARGLYVTRDGASTWEYVNGVDGVASSAARGNPDMEQMPAPSIADVLFDPTDPEMLYVASRPGAILRSQDGGATWEQAAAGLDPNEPVNDLLADPNRPGVFYAGSSLSGVFVSTDGGDTWQAIIEGLERKDVSVLALSQDGTVLYAGTASGNGGAGVWRLGTPPSAPASTPTAGPIVEVAPTEGAPIAQSEPSAAPRPTVNWLYLGLGAGVIMLASLAFVLGRRSRR